MASIMSAKSRTYAHFLKFNDSQLVKVKKYIPNISLPQNF